MGFRCHSNRYTKRGFSSSTRSLVKIRLETIAVPFSASPTSSSASSSCLDEDWCWITCRGTSSTSSHEEDLYQLFQNIAIQGQRLELYLAPSSLPTTIPWDDGVGSAVSQRSQLSTHPHGSSSDTGSGRQNTISSSNGSHCHHSQPSCIKLLPILQRARRLGILSHLVLADPSLFTVADQHSPHQKLPVTSITTVRKFYPLIFEILANQSLETLHVNLPMSSSSMPAHERNEEGQEQLPSLLCSIHTTTLCLFRTMGQAIARNPSLRTLSLYSYHDQNGCATATLLESMAAGHNTCKKKNYLQTLHIFCPLLPTSTTPRIISAVTKMLQTPSCSLRELEITCMRHHNHDTTMGMVPPASSSSSSSALTRFPLRLLVQEGILNNPSASLTTLGLYHCGLTTNHVDRDLLCPLLVRTYPPENTGSIARTLVTHGGAGTSALTAPSPLAPQMCSALEHIHLDGNHIDSLYFAQLMMKVGAATTGDGRAPFLRTVHMDHNPWQQLLQQQLSLLRSMPPPSPSASYCRHTIARNAHGHPNRRTSAVGSSMSSIEYHQGGPRTNHWYNHHDDQARLLLPVDDSLALLRMLNALLQRFPSLIHFGVDPSSPLLFPNSAYGDTHHRRHQREHFYYYPSAHGQHHHGQRRQRPHQLLFSPSPSMLLHRELAFGTLLNRSGLRQRQDDLIRMPLALWPRVMHRTTRTWGGQRSSPPRAINSNEQVRQQQQQQQLQEATNSPKHHSHGPNHRASTTNKKHYQERRRQKENESHQDQASLIYYLLRLYHPWIIGPNKEQSSY